MKKKNIWFIIIAIVIALIIIGVFCFIIPNKTKESSSEINNQKDNVITKSNTITFKNWDGSILEEKEVEQGTIPTYEEKEPVKKGTAKYTYEFKGWDKEIIAVNGDATYTAQYEKKYTNYVVIFNFNNGEVKYKKTYHYGDKITVPSNPTKESDDTYTYEFKGWDKEITTVKGNTTYTAQYEKQYIDYTIVFEDEDGTKLSEETYHYGDEVEAPEVSSKEQTLEYIYEFIGWDKEVTTVKGNATYKARYEKQYIDYTVIFEDEDGTKLSEKTYHYGDEVEVPEEPTKESDSTYMYKFKGWDKEITTVKGNTTYTAQYEKEYIDYTVIFEDEDGTKLSEETYHYGDEVEVPEEPTKAADSTYMYEFKGWDKEVTTVKGNTTYKAQYEKEYIDYTIIFEDEDGTKLSEETYHYGDEVEAPEVSSKEQTLEYIYEFIGWDKEVTTVKGNTTYKAQYEKQYIDYTVIFEDEDGTKLSEKTYHYGEEVEVPEEPTKAADSTYMYEFKGWDKEITTVKGNTTYTAQYEKEYIDYTVIFEDEDGTKLSEETYHYGDEVEVPSNLTKESDETYEYEFIGWDKEVTTVKGNTTYKAQYEKQYIDYTVIFEDEDGTKLSEETYHYGDEVEVPEEPTKAADNTYMYEFKGWDKEVTIVIGNATYVAQYDKEYIDYTIIFEDEEGTELSKKTYHYGEEVEVPEEPTKAADNTYMYEFKGWDKEVTIVKGNATYVAQYEKNYIDYIITFDFNNGKAKYVKMYHYGETVEVPPAPTKEPDNTYAYEFIGWDKEITIVNDNTTYVAQYKKVINQYTVTYADMNNQSILGTEIVKHGTQVSELTIPTKDGKVVKALYVNREEIANTFNIRENTTITIEYASMIDSDKILSNSLESVQNNNYDVQLKDKKIQVNFTNPDFNFSDMDSINEILDLLNIITGSDKYQSVILSYNNDSKHMVEIKNLDLFGALDVARFIGLVTTGKWSGSAGAEADVDKLVDATSKKPITVKVTLKDGYVDISKEDVVIYNLIFTCE